MKIKKPTYEDIIAFSVALVIMSVIFAPSLYIKDYKNIKVVEKQIMNDKYYVWCQAENGDYKVFTNKNNALAYKWDSDEIWAKIQVGNVYNFKTNGFRIKILNIFENIIEVE